MMPLTELLRCPVPIKSCIHLLLECVLDLTSLTVPLTIANILPKDEYGFILSDIEVVWFSNHLQLSVRNDL